MSTFKKILPMPYQSVLIFVVWLMLNNSISPGHILLGLVLALLIPYLTAPLRIPQPDIARPLKLLPYILLVMKDVVVANLQVALLVLGPTKNIKPGFIAVPLDIRQDLPVTMLASTVTMTPGTVSAEISQNNEYLYVHVLHLPEDPQKVIDYIKNQYEVRIKEIFGC